MVTAKTKGSKLRAEVSYPLLILRRRNVIKWKKKELEVQYFKVTKR